MSHDQLKSIIERIERLEGEKATIAGDIKEVYAEAKANGAAEREAMQSIIDTYMANLGMTPSDEGGKDVQ